MDQREYLLESAATKTCTWLLCHEEYTTWLAQRHTLLWIVGKPGAGKSTLIRYALQNSSFNNDVVASFFFYGRGSDLQKSACGMLRSLLHQLLDQTPELLSKFTLMFKKKRGNKQNSESDYEWHETELRESLQDLILSASRDRAIRLYLDALDEAGQEVAENLVAYFEELLERLHPTSPGLKVCFSCRHYPVLAPEHALKICVEEENHHDIATYVRQRMKKYRLSDPEEGPKLEQEIIEKSSCIFQWVVLIIPIIIQSYNDGASVMKIRQTIKEIPNKLSDLYQHILSNIRNPKRAVQLMQWICFAMEPLSLKELRYAMVVDITRDFRSLKECRRSVDFAHTDEQMRRTVNSLSGGLAETVEYENRQIVRFIHQSVNDYLIESGLQSLDSSFFHDVNDYLSRSKSPTLERSLSDNVIGLANFRLSRSCVRFMNLKEVLDETIFITDREKKSIRVNESEQKELICRFPLLQYCASWALHTRIVEKQRIPQADLIPLFRWPSEDGIRSWPHFFRNISLQDGQKGSLLRFASRNGLLSVIEAIIDSGVNVDFDIKCQHGRTPLIGAASHGHEAIVRLLIKRDDVDIEWGGRWGRTPLSLAARSGYEAVVRLLIELGAKIDSRDNKGRTPLSLAAEGGQEVVVRLLIELGAEIDSRDNEGRTPLSLVSVRSFRVVVARLLIQLGADIDSRDNNGRTPLSRAIIWGQEAVVRMLIELGAKINLRDNEGRTPLSWAARCGREELVSLLIKQDNVDVESKDNEGLTPIDHARNTAWSGGKGVVNLLENEILRRKNQLKD